MTAKDDPKRVAYTVFHISLCAVVSVACENAEPSRSTCTMGRRKILVNKMDTKVSIAIIISTVYSKIFSLIVPRPLIDLSTTPILDH